MRRWPAGAGRTPGRSTGSASASGLWTRCAAPWRRPRSSGLWPTRWRWPGPGVRSDAGWSGAASASVGTGQAEERSARHGPLYQALLGEAQHNPAVAADLNDRFITPQAEKTVARLRKARDQGQLSPDFDLDVAMDILSGPLYFRVLITQQPLTHDYVDRMLDALFTGMGPSPETGAGM
ncbi:TetR-like C-terminal domain-containing protein [Streptosporangium canum]|uniref:TetR-like C-terminal domain-containing protein n=1 Tax=Streptosporangium canum TaxID=324952 RepID=UPI000B869BF9|nr:TetR-like C-terminal domain-containing protein [Streptosporangium canum]